MVTTNFNLKFPRFGPKYPLWTPGPQGPQGPKLGTSMPNIIGNTPHHQVLYWTSVAAARAQKLVFGPITKIKYILFDGAQLEIKTKTSLCRAVLQ